MVLKIPPPPPLPQSFGGFGQQFNRWLLEIQAILNAEGQINPDTVAGLPALIAQVAVLVTEVATLTVEVAANTANIATNTANIATNTANIATNTAAITALQANAVVRNGTGVPGVGLGSNGDLYIDNNYPGTNRLYAKIGGVWKSIV